MPSIEIASRIGDEWVHGEGAMRRNVNPSSPGQEVCHYSELSPQVVASAVAGSREAVESWGSASPELRGAILRRAADIVEDSAEQISQELSREEGKLLAESKGEVARTAQILRFHAFAAGQEIGKQFASPRPSERIVTLRQPRGLIMAITPWNFPLAIPAWKIAPALAYGNCVLWKPSSVSPLMAFRLVEALAAAGLPAHVLNLLLIGSESASTVAHDPQLDAITFTGSNAVGEGLIHSCASIGTPVQAELGGKNAAIVWRDADLEVAADEVVAGAMGSTGQRCTSTGRLVIDRRIEDQFVDMVVERVNSLQVGDPLEPDSDLGPLATSKAREDVTEAIRHAVDDEGCRVLGDWEYPSEGSQEGWFVRPAVIACDDPSSDTWCEEIFGPVLAVMGVDDWSEALAVANAGRFGLSGSIYTNDWSKVEQAEREFHVGVLHINSPTIGADLHVPFGGIKSSGWGPKEQGFEAREFFTTTKTIYRRACDSSRT
jgi:alpha-ketoglutaric semialdehyde dehydrogenase